MADAREASPASRAGDRLHRRPDAPYTRVPGDKSGFALRTVGFRRRAEVEIHHADLDLGYTPDD